MLEISYNLVKKRGGYDIVFKAEEKGKVIKEILLQDIKRINTKGLTTRKQTIGLDNKGLTISLNIINL